MFEAEDAPEHDHVHGEHCDHEHDHVQHDHAHHDHAPAPVSGDAAAPKAGRNDPCPCGSGKKFKKCHGA
ncbi:MAG: SEC-C metal-binding domain-containing protein [Bryobacteraceae bacterium]